MAKIYSEVASNVFSVIHVGGFVVSWNGFLVSQKVGKK
jgi:hypothetical protein